MSDPLPERLRDLLRPEAFGAAKDAPVALRTTHASWVFLLPDEVWKLKRPVDLGFLDFRTTEARRSNCEQEVRLNRRLAPDVYLGVAPVRRTAGGLVVGGENGPIEDWAVHMRRLPEEASAEAMLARGILDGPTLTRLAHHVAGFLTTARETPAFGAVDVLRASVDENFDQVAPFVGDLVDRATFQEVEGHQKGLLDAAADRFEGRVIERRIREGHGDLRLEHVYFLPRGGRPPEITIIDCIEFNERFRCGDTAGEVAFLAMELEAAGRPELAGAFLARFAEASDDFGLYDVVDFYQSYRAWVRGKVAGFVAVDPSASAELRGRKREEARRDFALARAFGGVPMQAPFVLAVGGAPGTGKSTLATGLGEALAVPVVSTDRARKALAGIAPTARGDAGLYTTEMTERTYAEAFRRSAAVLESGRGVILDATFSASTWRAAASALANRFGARFAFLEARCQDKEVLRSRLEARAAAPSVSDATAERLDALLARYQPIGPDDPGPVLAVDTSGSAADSLAAALEHLCRLELGRTARTPPR